MSVYAFVLGPILYSIMKGQSSIPHLRDVVEVHKQVMLSARSHEVGGYRSRALHRIISWRINLHVPEGPVELSHREGSEFYGNVAAQVGAGVGGRGWGWRGRRGRQVRARRGVPRQLGRRFDVVA